MGSGKTYVRKRREQTFRVTLFLDELDQFQSIIHTFVELNTRRREICCIKHYIANTKFHKIFVLFTTRNQQNAQNVLSIVWLTGTTTTTTTTTTATATSLLGGECCTRFYVHIGLDIKCTLTVKQFVFIILLLMLFDRIHPVMSLKQWKQHHVSPPPLYILRKSLRVSNYIFHHQTKYRLKFQVKVGSHKKREQNYGGRVILCIAFHLLFNSVFSLLMYYVMKNMQQFSKSIF